MDLIHSYERYAESVLSRAAGAQIESFVDNSLLEIWKLASFDAAWWGWGHIADTGTRIHNSYLRGVNSSIQADLREVSSVNPITRSLAASPNEPAMYDRLSDCADPKWVAFAAKYDIRQMMVSVSQDQPWKPFMFISLYRKGDSSLAWNERERSLFHKVVKFTSSIIQYCDTSCNKGKSYDTMYLDVGPGGGSAHALSSLT